MLLRRKRTTVDSALEQLVGMQAQAPNTPYVGLWTRLHAFRPEELADLITRRRAVRIALMRSTIHLVTSPDCLFLRPLVQPVLERGLTGRVGRELEGVDRRELAAFGRKLIEDHPRTASEVTSVLGERWPGRDPNALTNALRALVPLVQIPPRGIWGTGGRPVVTSMEHWLDRSPDPRPSMERMVSRYLQAFGPASVADIQTWSGLTRLREVTDGMRSQLRVLTDEHGNQLLDVQSAPLPSPDTPAPVRFLPEFDNMLLSHADRTRVLTHEHRRFVATRGGMVPGSLLIDGFFTGTWNVARKRTSAVLTVEPYGKRLPKQAVDETEQEALRLLGFVAPEHEHDVVIAAPR
jgi:hypothetical protein